MPRFTVEFTQTEVTRRKIEVEAESPEDAVHAVSEYEVDTSSSVQTDSIRFEISDVEA